MHTFSRKTCSYWRSSDESLAPREPPHVEVTAGGVMCTATVGAASAAPVPSFGANGNG